MLPREQKRHFTRVDFPFARAFIAPPVIQRLTYSKEKRNKNVPRLFYKETKRPRCDDRGRRVKQNNRNKDDDWKKER